MQPCNFHEISCKRVCNLRAEWVACRNSCKLHGWKSFPFSATFCKVACSRLVRPTRLHPSSRITQGWISISLVFVDKCAEFWNSQFSFSDFFNNLEISSPAASPPFALAHNSLAVIQLINYSGFAGKISNKNYELPCVIYGLCGNAWSTIQIVDHTVRSEPISLEISCMYGQRLVVNPTRTTYRIKF